MEFSAPHIAKEVIRALTYSGFNHVLVVSSKQALLDKVTEKLSLSPMIIWEMGNTMACSIYAPYTAYASLLLADEEALLERFAGYCGAIKVMLLDDEVPGPIKGALRGTAPEAEWDKRY